MKSKHLIAFLMWLYQRNLKVAPTEIKCIGKKQNKLPLINNYTVSTLQDFGAVHAANVPHSE